MRITQRVENTCGKLDLIKTRHDSLSYEQTERQRQRQASAAASPMQVYGDATHDAWNGSQTHSQNLPLDPAAWSVHTLRVLHWHN